MAIWKWQAPVPRGCISKNRKHIECDNRSIAWTSYASKGQTIIRLCFSFIAKCRKYSLTKISNSCFFLWNLWISFIFPIKIYKNLTNAYHGIPKKEKYTLNFISCCSVLSINLSFFIKLPSWEVEKTNTFSVLHYFVDYTQKEIFFKCIFPFDNLTYIAFFDTIKLRKGGESAC